MTLPTPSQDRDGTPRATTLLALVQELTDEIESPDGVAVLASAMICDGRVELTGNFRGRRIELPVAHSQRGWHGHHP